MEKAGFSGAGTASTVGGLPIAARRWASSFLLTGNWIAAAGSVGFCRQVRSTGQTPCKDPMLSIIVERTMVKLRLKLIRL